MKLSIITLTYNNLEYTKKYIDSLYKYTDDFELIVVDNGSTDGTKEYLNSLTGNVKKIFNDNNLGFSKGNNQGLNVAEGEYIAFLNNDILLSPNWFEETEKIFIRENAAFVSPRQVNPHFDDVNENNYIEYWNKNNKYEKDFQKTFDDCSFSCVVTKSNVIKQIGNFDENYTPAFFEDNDIKYRAIENGFDIYVSNRACFFHYGSVTSGRLNLNYKKNRDYYFQKNKFAEYLSLNSEEGIRLKIQTRDFEKFPLNLFYEVFKICGKVKRRIVKIIKK